MRSGYQRFLHLENVVLTQATTHILFLGLIPGAIAIKLIATLECFIGICLLANR